MKQSLLNYSLPEDMERYLSYYGFHFNKKLYEFAVSNMEKRNRTTGEKEKLSPVQIEDFERSLRRYRVSIPENNLYDAAYLASMVDADFWGSSIEDEEHMARYIEDVLCDVDGYEGIVFSRFLADCGAKGNVIFWDRML
jgi:hypothetical protein